MAIEERDPFIPGLGTEQCRATVLQLGPTCTVHLLGRIELEAERRNERAEGRVELRLEGCERHVLTVDRLVHVVPMRAAVEQVGAARSPAAHRVDAEEDA